MSMERKADDLDTMVNVVYVGPAARRVTRREIILQAKKEIDTHTDAEIASLIGVGKEFPHQLFVWPDGSKTPDLAGAIKQWRFVASKYEIEK